MIPLELCGKRCNEEFMKAGLRGITILFASGDDGVGSSNVECDHAVPEWPTGSPYVTAVGATQLFSEYLPACGESYAVCVSTFAFPLAFAFIFRLVVVNNSVALLSSQELSPKWGASRGPTSLSGEHQV